MLEFFFLWKIKCSQQFYNCRIFVISRHFRHSVCVYLSINLFFLTLLSVATLWNILFYLTNSLKLFCSPWHKNFKYKTRLNLRLKEVTWLSVTTLWNIWFYLNNSLLLFCSPRHKNVKYKTRLSLNV